MESPRESLIEPEIFNNANVLPDNSTANATISNNLLSEDNSACSAGSIGKIEQGTAKSCQCTQSLLLSLKWPHGKRVASDRHSENLIHTSIHQYTEVYKGTHGYTAIYMVIHQYTQVYLGMHQFTWVHGYAPVYTGIHGYTPVYMGMHQSTQVP